MEVRYRHQYHKRRNSDVRDIDAVAACALLGKGGGNHGYYLRFIVRYAIGKHRFRQPLLRWLG